MAGAGSYMDPVLLTRRVRQAVVAELGLPPDGGDVTFSPPAIPGGPGAPVGTKETTNLFRFFYGGKWWEVDLIEVGTLFAIGSIVMVQSFDPGQHPRTELYGLPIPIQNYIFYLGALRPGRYEYQLNLVADVARLQDYVYDSAAPGNLAGQTPAGGNFGGGNTLKTFQTRPIPASAFQNVSAFFDNETNQSGTFNLLGFYDQNGSSPGVVLATGTINAATTTAQGADLTKVIIPYIVAQIVFGSAPTSGYLRLIPYGKRGT